MAEGSTLTRLTDLKRLYVLLDRVAHLRGGLITLDQLGGLPLRGVYYFFEVGEERRESGRGPRVVRVGTHALGAGSQSTLRQRLSQHRGAKSGGGNHRGSIFRLLVGQAILARSPERHCRTWGMKGEARMAALGLGMEVGVLKSQEAPVEQLVSRYLAAMRVLVLDVPDEPGPQSLRGQIERNSIALLSNRNRPALDPPSAAWLGNHSNRPLVRYSGLWNQNHVEEIYNPAYLDELEKLIERGGSA